MGLGNLGDLPMQRSRCECHECTQARVSERNPFASQFIYKPHRCNECQKKIEDATTPGAIVEVHPRCV